MSERAAQQCHGKRRYRSERRASAAARRTQRFVGEAMHAYFCEYCKGWHVGSARMRLRPERELPRAERYLQA